MTAAVPRAAGRPRDERVDAAVREAAVAELLEVGYARLSIEGVARRAGVGKGAIYRRWRSKAELVFDVAVHPAEIGPPPDQGSLRADLAGLVEIIAASLGRPASAAAAPALLAELAADPELAARVDARFIDPERRLIEALLERAVARGELPDASGAELAHALTLGACFARLHLLRRPSADPDELAAAVARALGGSER
jgi:AcrR family transcriptional regulator